jgi:hypothetical protein
VQLVWPPPRRAGGSAPSPHTYELRRKKKKQKEGELNGIAVGFAVDDGDVFTVL